MSFGIPVRNGLGVGLLASTSLSTRGGGFSPTSLFLAGEQGFIYDPSDFSTLYQDAAGTVPVTAAGQSVGLVLDKRLGLVPGANVLPTLDFTDAVVWLPVSGGTLTRDSASSFTTTASGGLRRPSTLSVGSWYRITFNYTATAGLGVRNASNNANVVGTDVSAGSGVFSAFFNAIDTNLYFRLTAAGSLTVSNIVIRELPGNHASQTTAASKPLLQQDATGRYYLLFDGTDDFLVTPTITPGTDKVQVFAGVRKLSAGTATAIIAESSASAAANAGSIRLVGPSSIGENYFWGSAGTGFAAAATTANSYIAPITNVLTGIGDIASDTTILRVNGAQAASSTADQGTGNYLAYPMYIGRRAGTSLPFNGRIYSLISRFGADLTSDQIAQTEVWVNGKTGAY